MAQDRDIGSDGWVGVAKCVGFIPKSLFYEDPTGNLALKKEVLFFCEGEVLPWLSIWEAGGYVENTPADDYDRRNKLGKFLNVNFHRGCCGEVCPCRGAWNLRPHKIQNPQEDFS